MRIILKLIKSSERGILCYMLMTAKSVYLLRFKQKYTENLKIKIIIIFAPRGLCRVGSEY